MNLVDMISQQQLKPADKLSKFNVGDTVRVHFRIVEGEKEQRKIAEYTTKDGREILVKQNMRYEPKSQINRIQWHYFINGAFDSIQNLDMRLFFPQELDSYLKWNGFNIIHKFGSFEEEAFNDDSVKQIFVCQEGKSSLSNV